MKILLYTDLTIRPDQLFWHRDLGLLTKAFRDLGHEAYLVVHLATEPRTTPAIPNELAHTREQPCVAQQGLPRPSVAGPYSEIRAQARPANAGQNPPVAGALHSSDRYSESSEVGPPAHMPPFSKSNIKHPTSKILEDPVLWPSPSDVRDPLWWKDHHPDLVILGLWTRPKYDPTGRAALASKARLIERCDSVGFRLPSCGHWQFWKNTISAHNDALPNRPIAIDTSESRD